RNEDSLWAPVPRIYTVQRVSLAGTLEGLEGIEPGSNIKIKPYIVGSFAQNGLAGTHKYDGDAGFDVKYGITSGLTWDFTYNTDFSQVEADEQKINLTRYSLRFPEKRDFFLEDSGISNSVPRMPSLAALGVRPGATRPIKRSIRGAIWFGMNLSFFSAALSDSPIRAMRSRFSAAPG